MIRHWVLTKFSIKNRKNATYGKMSRNYNKSIYLFIYYVVVVITMHFSTLVLHWKYGNHQNWFLKQKSDAAFGISNASIADILKICFSEQAHLHFKYKLTLFCHYVFF